MSFTNRVFGCVVVKSINSNYNADFSHQPRSLPNGTVYATDKALKYSIKNYLRDFFPEEKIFYFKSLKNDTGNPRSLDERFEFLFPKDKATKEKKIVSQNLLSCLDIRLFGATYANKAKKLAISVHGPVQINHGINIWHENNIYSEQIQSPFSDPSAPKEGKEADEKAQTTLGRQSKLQEGHYLHHFSVNPNNLRDIIALAGEDAEHISDEDIQKLKDAMSKGVTYYDSASKAGTDNELLLWVQLKKESRIVLPNFNSLITEQSLSKDGSKMIFDFSKVSSLLSKYRDELEKVEIFYQKENTEIQNAPEMATHLDLN